MSLFCFCAGPAGGEETDGSDQNPGAPPGDGTPGTEEPAEVHERGGGDAENQHGGVAQTGQHF